MDDSICLRIWFTQTVIIPVTTLRINYPDGMSNGPEHLSQRGMAFELNQHIYRSMVVYPWTKCGSGWGLSYRKTSERFRTRITRRIPTLGEITSAWYRNHNGTLYCLPLTIYTHEYFAPYVLQLQFRYFIVLYIDRISQQRLIINRSMKNRTLEKYSGWDHW